MATEEFLRRSIAAGKPYDALPDRIRAIVSLSDWKFRVKDFCMQRGHAWADSLARAACSEGEYYESLLAFYQENLRIFPYHLADYVCRVLRVSAFRYCCGLLAAVLREERSYDRIPNFTAADVVRLTGVGRNEYIAILNKCKAKKLLWRVNRAPVVKELLPTEPLEIEVQPWWTVHVVNLGEAEYQRLAPEELAVAHACCRPEGLRARDAPPPVLQALHKRGLVYFDVRIRPTDHVAIPPLEGFVSNKDSEAQADKGDPLEAVLYGVFVATSARATVADLARMLSVDQARVQAAVSVACRLGFARRLPPPGEDAASPGSDAGPARDLELGSEAEAGGAEAAGQRGSESGGGGEAAGQGVALVVGVEVASYLMMGAMSPGLKRHSVTLFEGGRVGGAEVIDDLITELHASAEAAQQFEGEMQKLGSHASALATALECIRSAAGNAPLELLRKESLAGLAPAAAARVLRHSYAAVVPIAPLPAPPLPLAPPRPGPTNFGATAEASTPWLQLALCQAVGGGPDGLVLAAGQRFARLPPCLAAASHALLWPWDAAAVRAQEVPIVVDAAFMLDSLNEHLRRTPLLVQPLDLPPGADPGQLPLADVALPLPPDHGPVQGFHPDSGEAQTLGPLPGVAAAVAQLGLGCALGRLRLLRTAAPDGREAWQPLSLQLGLPLQPEPLCAAVCRGAAAAGFLSPDSRAAHERGQAALQSALFALISAHGACSASLAPGRAEEAGGAVDLPLHNLALRGGRLARADLAPLLQGCAALFVE